MGPVPGTCTFDARTSPDQWSPVTKENVPGDPCVGPVDIGVGNSNLPDLLMHTGVLGMTSGLIEGFKDGITRNGLTSGLLNGDLTGEITTNGDVLKLGMTGLNEDRHDEVKKGRTVIRGDGALLKEGITIIKGEVDLFKEGMTVIKEDADIVQEGTTVLDGDRDTKLASIEGSTTVISNSSDIYVPLKAKASASHFIEEASVSGFAPVKRRSLEIKDMAFVVEVTWSDGRTHMVKRTFTDFYNLHFYLLDEWSSAPGKSSPLKLTHYLPERGHGVDESSIEVAEARELQLNRYVQELIKLPQQISACPTVLTFFESRGTDPKPYRETVNSSKMNIADQYVLCWI